MRRIHNVPAATVSKIFFRQPAEFEQMSQQACFQWLIGMNLDRKSDIHARFAVDVVAALDSQEFPAVLRNALAQFLAADVLHTAISTMRASWSSWGGWTSTARQPSTAS